MGFWIFVTGFAADATVIMEREREGVGNFLVLAGSKNNWRFKWIYPNSIHKGQENQSACAIGYVNSQRTHVIYVTKLSLSGVPPPFFICCWWYDLISTLSIYAFPHIHVRPLFASWCSYWIRNGLIFSFFNNHTVLRILKAITQ